MKMEQNQPVGYDEKGNVRFEQGSKVCQNCGTEEQIIQYQTKNIIKELPVTEIRFICKPCALKLKIPIK